ncbi:hypothetical protein [Candidatus Coxiella mudrowiae]|uniref:hypothetical protein n=1 Tax=Candidatus Coxiella mudrowiae TaxID=2054173 RepID=UPI00138E03AA|nr:hypothetical protein [Candidatus Coxiella mudrowiae]
MSSLNAPLEELYLPFAELFSEISIPVVQGEYIIVYFSEDGRYTVVKPQGGYYREINLKTGRVDYLKPLIFILIMRLYSTLLQP